MESSFLINLLFFFSGVCLNSVVIICFWRSMRIRTKLCYFMIMVLSCCDLLGVVAKNSFAVVTAILFMTGKFGLNASWPYFFSRSTNLFPASSLIALLVMNFDRYLATSHPIFHQTSVTKRRLFTIFAVLLFIEVVLTSISVNDSIILYQVHVLIFFVFVSPPMLFRDQLQTTYGSKKKS